MQGSRRAATSRKLGDGDVGLWVAYEDRHHAKAIPTARWDRHLKCWRVRSALAGEVTALVARLNGRDARASRGPQADSVVMARAMTELFAALPAELRRPVHRALARVLHPDMGGDHASMQALNAAVEQTA